METKLAVMKRNRSPVWLGVWALIAEVALPQVTPGDSQRGFSPICSTWHRESNEERGVFGPLV